ncbi:MAG: KpsF/GutQ family sugar-phosphate isomerase [Acidobacteria bacterium]|nr:KpsF/GutQ family sugar-phosphate isomerase [Acidobacteriota bacterium]MCI0718479.1 KpsF/GutQ family sugar-phosphate isomerase [Acidobacteriota bacterium]
MISESAKKVLRIEAEAITGLVDRIDHRFEAAIEALYACSGRVVVTGMGKSGIICRKIAATLASTGSPSLFLHPAEANHGDLGMIVRGDVVLAVSNSGETEELLWLAEALKRLGIFLISLVGNPDSRLARASDVVLDVSISREACPLGLAPTASTTAALAMGDALAIALSEKRGFKAEDFAHLHPGGKLGKRFQRVENLMHSGNLLPAVGTETPMRDVIYEISKKGLGVTAVVGDGSKVVGVITDGDLRRLLQQDESMVKSTAGACMHPNPLTISRDELAAVALRMMEEKKVTSLLVASPEGVLEGVIHIHDLWQTQMF